MAHPSHYVEDYPHKPAIIMGSSGEVVTYRQLDERSNQGAQLFRSLGLKTGDHIGMMLENSRHFFEIVWAALRSGIVFTPISTHLKHEETLYILQNCGAKLFIGSLALSEVAEALLEQPSEVEHYFMVGGVKPGFESWEEAIDSQPETPIADQSRGAPMLYSSGTTGQPKGIYLPPPEGDFDDLLPIYRPIAEGFGISSETVYLSPAPLYHAAPLAFNMVTQSCGGTSIIMETYDSEEALRLIEEHLVTHSQWVPIMFVRMLKLPAEVRERYDLSSMHMAIHAAAPCPVEIKQQMIDWWGEIIYEYYGASEGAGLTMITPQEWLKHRGSVGRAMAGELHIVDEDGSELPAGEVGTVYFGGAKTKFEYFQEPEKTAEAYTKEGWSTQGDVGYVDEEGYLYLTDRKNFMIISGGVNIYPQEIENLLITHEKIADVAVFGVPDEEFGEKVQAVVEPLNWADATDEVAFEIMEWLRERLSSIKLPRSLDFHEKLPRMDNGKLYKRRLADDYRERAVKEQQDKD